MHARPNADDTIIIAVAFYARETKVADSITKTRQTSVARCTKCQRVIDPQYGAGSQLCATTQSRKRGRHVCPFVDIHTNGSDVE